MGEIDRLLPASRPWLHCHHPHPEVTPVKTRLSFRVPLACASGLLLLAGAAQAELVSIDWHTREPFAENKAFGDAGPYERLIGVARFAVDPAGPRNKLIVDLENAPRNARRGSRGLVEF